MPASLIASPTKKANTQINRKNPKTINPQLSPWFLGHSAQRLVPCRLKVAAHAWQRRDVLRNPKAVLHVLLRCNEEVAASGWRFFKRGFAPPKQAGANKHSAKTCCWRLGSLSFFGMVHHPNWGGMCFQAIGPVQSPPVGQGRHSHRAALAAVSFKYSVSLQLAVVFQLRLRQVEEPWFGCCHPAGQAMHDVLGSVF